MFNLRILDTGTPLRRMWPLWIIFALCFAVVLYLNPAKAGLTLYGIGKVALGGIIGYGVDRFTFREHERPHVLDGIERGTAWKRRSWIICAAIIAMALVP
ncbi:MAG: putative holin [Pseudomonadota bacterium]|nr:putative holin [Pseudomonadota bacterium]